MQSAMASSVLPEQACILVAGPEGGLLDRWGHLLAPALAQALPPEIALHRTMVGAADGVTGANQFGARTAPDGETVLLAPGEAAMAWLVGDPRAHYDVAHWLSVMVAVSPGIVMARPGVMDGGRRLRMASPGPASIDLPAILGIEILGREVNLLPPLGDEAQLAAIAQGGIDVAYLHGHKVPEQVRAMAAAGAQPLFALGAMDANGSAGRSLAFPDIPTLAELYPTVRGQTLAGPLYTGWCASAAASQLEFALVLPQLTPPAMVALWRRAGSEAAGALDVQSLALANGLRAIGGGEATATAGRVAAGQPALQALRGWLANRFNWKPA
jgi:hypothetical protein